MATADILYYVHDPMCSWCWGYRPTWQRLKSELPEDLRLVYLVGGLAPDSDLPMAAEIQNGLQETWRTIGQQLGAAFNFDFWKQNTPRRSTYPACRAVLAAESLAGKGEEMIEAIQVAYYLNAKNTSDASVLAELAQGIGIDADAFLQWIGLPAHEAAFRAEMAFARDLPISGFPSLVLGTRGTSYPITLDYRNLSVSLDDIADKRAGNFR